MKSTKSPTNKDMKNKITRIFVRIILLITVVFSTFYPCVVNAKEASTEIKEELQFKKNFNENENTTNEVDGYVCIRTKEDFIKKYKNGIPYYELKLDIASTDEDSPVINFDYKLATEDSLSLNIQVNNTEYSLRDEIPLELGENTIRVDEVLYKNLEKLDIMSNVKPLITVKYNDETLTVQAVNNIANAPIAVKIYLPNNMSVANYMPTYNYNKTNNSIDIEGIEQYKPINIPLIVEESSQTQKIEYEYVYGKEQYKEAGEVMVDETEESTTSLNVPSTYKKIMVGEKVGDNKEIDNVEELIDLYDISINQGMEEKEIDKELLKSGKFKVTTDANFPISTINPKDYNFTINYTTPKGENLVSSLTLNIANRDGIEPHTTGKYAKNIAYGCQDTSCDNGVGVIGKERILFYNMDYKINALSHEITARIDISKDLELSTSGDSIYSMTVTDQTFPSPNSITIDEDNTEVDTNPGSFKMVSSDLSNVDEPHYIYEIKTGSLEETIDSGTSFKRSGEYSIEFKDGTDKVEYIAVDGSLQTVINIAVPETILYDNETPETTDDILYGLIGDGINNDTDQSKISPSDKVSPTVTGNKFGVYELESIGYEDANNIGSISTLAADWSTNDLTLAKYDHIIRPVSGNYLIASNIDASVTDEGNDASLYQLDIEGGWTSDSDLNGIADTNDGFRPIGQIIGTIDGKDSIVFTGNITGNVNDILGSSVGNSVITDIYIYEPTIEKVGIIASLDGTVDNLGLEGTDKNKTHVTGYRNTGAMVGFSLGDDALVKNVYSTINLKGNDWYVGGLVGRIENGDIENSYATGNIEGAGGAGGLLGFSATGTISNSYATGNVNGTRYVGGLAGQLSGTIINSYATGDVNGTLDVIGGLVGQESETGLISNSYATGNVEGRDEVGGLVGLSANVRNSYATGNVKGMEAVGGLVGYGSIIENSYATGNVKGESTEEGGIGGLVGIQFKGRIKNSYASGNIRGVEAVGGLVGFNTGVITNSYAIGNVSGKACIKSATLDCGVGGLIGSNDLYSVTPGSIINSYAYEGQIITDNKGTLSIIDDEKNVINNLTIVGDDLNSTTFSPYIATYTNLIDTTEPINWYNNPTVGSGLGWESSSVKDITPPNLLDEGGEAGLNWTSPWTYGEDTNLDGEIDDTSKLVCMPHIMNDIGSNSDISDNNGTYVPAQPCIEILNPTPAVEFIDYKINAITLDIQLKILVNEASSGTIDVYSGIKNLRNPIGTPEFSISYNISTTGEQIITILGTDGLRVPILSDADYTIVIDSSTGEGVHIHTPKQVESGGIVYGVIGDNINVKTDVKDRVESDKVNPTTTSNTYGIYELESIGYEDANSVDWSGNDLTLAKYDHIIRPIDGNYLIANDIDGTDLTDTDLDNTGGFGTDGYRPIGQVIGSTGDTPIEFTGTITGDVDSLCGVNKCTSSVGIPLDKSTVDNSVITDLYINAPTINNVGMISIGNDAQVIDLGIVDPSITGNSNVGAIAGQMIDSNTLTGDGSEILNTYVLENRNDTTAITFDIVGNSSYVGGIAGNISNTVISSFGRINGVVNGINDSSILNVQPSEIYPDKDGYKTFTSVDIKGDSKVGGIAGNAKDSKFDKVYNKSTVRNTNGLMGGIVGYTEDNTRLYNVYNYANIISDKPNVGGLIGYVNISDSAVNETIIQNSYNLGDIKAYYNTGGIVGAFNTNFSDEQLHIENVYNAGNVLSTRSDDSAQTGGIVGNGVNDNDSNRHVNITIKNTINIGSVTSKRSYAAGILGQAFSGSVAGDESTIILENCLNIGEITSDSSGLSDVFEANAMIGYFDIHPDLVEDAKKPQIRNVYGIENSDFLDNSFGIIIPLASSLNTPAWWKETFFANDSTNYNNWNISALDASLPSFNADISDESIDDELDTVLRGVYPHVLEKNETGDPVNEVPEQSDQLIPVIKYDVALEDYKINAVTLDIYLEVNIEELPRANYDGTINIYKGTSITDPLVGTLSYTPISGESTIKIPGSIGIEDDTTYTVSILDAEENQEALITIHTPTQEKIGGETYAVIGDGQNDPTDVNGVLTSTHFDQSKVEDSTLVTSQKAYGIYELESIGYEDANNITIADSESKADWSEDDLTLYKYDHIIRPIDGQYIIKGGIDATAVYETILTLDKKGGFSSDSNIDGDDIINNPDNNDGFRPIGAIIGQMGGTITPIEFTGKLTADNNVNILNIYINNSTSFYQAIISKNAGDINNIHIRTNNSTSKVVGKNYVGGLVANNTGYINSSSSDVNIEAYRRSGGLVGSSSGTIENSYSTAKVEGDNDLGGLVGTNYKFLKNCYATGDVIANYTQYGNVGGLMGVNVGTVQNSYATGDVIAISTYTGTVEIYVTLGGLIGENEGEIYNSYATGNIKNSGSSSSEGLKVGGLVGGNRKIIENSYATGNIDVDASKSTVGGLAGSFNKVDGSIEINNSYSYETQKINGVLIEPTQVLGEDPTYNKIATYEELSNTDGNSTTDWYLDTLGWSTSILDAAPSVDWTSPYIYGIGEDASKICHPHNYITAGTDYVPEQPCEPIKTKPTPGAVGNFKVDAMTLNTYLKMTAAGSYDITVTNENTGVSTTRNLTTGSNNVITLLDSDFNFEQDTTYNIMSLPDTNFNIHMPKQKIVDGDLYALIGDDVNEEVDEELVFTTSKVSPSTAPTSQLSDTNKAYGIYELESIGYEDSNGGLKESEEVLLPVIVDKNGSIKQAEASQAKNGEPDTHFFTPKWGASDLTLAKYDHIIRPLDGYYMIDNSIDASPTYNQRAVLDTKGGFATDANGDGAATSSEYELDGFRPIGEQNSEDYVEKFTGRLTGNPDKDIIIEDLYINLDDDDYHDPFVETYRNYGALIKIISPGAVVANFGITSDMGSGTTTSSINGVYDNGVFTGWNEGTIANVYTDALATGQNTSGGIAGVNSGLITNCFTQGKVNGYGIGGIAGVTFPISSQHIINSYSTADFSGRMAGGIVGADYGLDDDESTIENVYTTKTRDSTSVWAGALVGDYCETEIDNSLYRGIATDNNGSNKCSKNIHNTYDMATLTSGQLTNPTWYTNTLLWNSSGTPGDVGKDYLAPGTDGTQTCYPMLYKDPTYLSTTTAPGQLIANQECTVLSRATILADDVEEVVEVNQIMQSENNKQIDKVNVSEQQKYSELKEQVDSESNQALEILFDEEEFESDLVNDIPIIDLDN